MKTTSPKLTARSLAAGAVLFSLGASQAHADISVSLNGQPLATSVAPVQIGGRTLVPMRDIFEALGAQLNWNPANMTIQAQKDTTQIGLAINNRQALVNGRTVNLDQPPVLLSGRTFVPLRFVAEALNAQVGWNDAMQMVSIQSSTQIAALPNQNLEPAYTTPTAPTYQAPYQAPATQPAANPPYTTPAYTAPYTAPATQPTYPAYQPPTTQPATNPANDPGSPFYIPPAPLETPREQVAGYRTISIPEGAVVPVSLDSALNSATARVGQRFTSTVVSRRMGDSEFPAGTKSKELSSKRVRKPKTSRASWIFNSKTRFCPTAPAFRSMACSPASMIPRLR